MILEANINNRNNEAELGLDDLTQRLLDLYQRDFPIVSRPFADMAEQLGCLEPEVLSKLLELKDNGIVTRIGPVFDHKKAGASLLAAVSVPEDQVEQVAQQINDYAEVNHNYGREHAYNLWFVVTAPSKRYLHLVLDHMEHTIGYPILRLPMEKAYHIDLGFHVGQHRTAKPFIQHIKDSATKMVKNAKEKEKPQAVLLLSEPDQKKLRALIQQGFPLTRKPFERLAQLLGFDDETVIINTIRFWLDSGLIKRIGLVTNHHSLGFKSNAMVVWDIPEDQVDRVGEQFKESGLVSLCYKRKRQLPEWPYNLFCMIHSRDRETVTDHIEKLVALAGLEDIQKDVLVSTCQYKQKGGAYVSAPNSSHTPIEVTAANSDSLPMVSESQLKAQGGSFL